MSGFVTSQECVNIEHEIGKGNDSGVDKIKRKKNGTHNNQSERILILCAENIKQHKRIRKGSALFFCISLNSTI